MWYRCSLRFYYSPTTKRGVLYKNHIVPLFSLSCFSPFVTRGSTDVRLLDRSQGHVGRWRGQGHTSRETGSYLLFYVKERLGVESNVLTMLILCVCLRSRQIYVTWDPF